MTKLRQKKWKLVTRYGIVSLVTLLFPITLVNTSFRVVAKQKL